MDIYQQEGICSIEHIDIAPMDIDGKQLTLFFGENSSNNFNNFVLSNFSLLEFMNSSNHVEELLARNQAIEITGKI